MDIIKEICQDNFIESLGLKHWSSLELLERVNDLVTGNAFVVILENFSGKKIEIIVRNSDNLKKVWKSIQISYGRMKKGISVKHLLKRFNLSYKDMTFDENSTVSSLGITENDVIRFKRKTKQSQISIQEKPRLRNKD